MTEIFSLRWMLDVTHGKKIWSLIELSWHSVPLRHNMVAIDALLCDLGCCYHVTMVQVAPGRWPGDGATFCLSSGMGINEGYVCKSNDPFIPMASPAMLLQRLAFEEVSNQIRGCRNARQIAYFREINIKCISVLLYHTIGSHNRVTSRPLTFQLIKTSYVICT